MTQPDATQLHPFIVDHFSLDELKTLCLNLKVRYDDLGGEGLSGKARELVLFMERTGRLVDLRAVVAQLRPDLYHAAFGDIAAVQTVTAAPPRRGWRFAERNPHQIFISHAVTDAGTFAHRLADDLRRAGYAIWIAPESIPDGQWVSAINRGLAESGVMLLVLTPGALESPWVEMETNVAIELERADEMRFIPICLERRRYDPMWHAYQWVMFDGDYSVGLSELMGRLAGKTAILGSSSQQSETTIDVEKLRSQPDKVFPPTVIVGPPPKPEIRIHEKTGIELIRIPAGPFLYGSADSDEMAFYNEKPQRTVELPEYWIGRYPVTNKQYKRFLDANPEHRVPFVDDHYSKPYNWNDLTRTYSLDMADHPVVLVDWFDAKAFCDWAGLQLPTEEEWEKAARGTDGCMWPWGNASPTVERCNFDRNIGGTTPVGKYSPQGDSPYDCADMAGNVWEWTASRYDASDRWRMLKGGSWGEKPHDCRCARRSWYPPLYIFLHFGFRVVETLQ